MSTALSPRSEIEPSFATEPVVIRSLHLFVHLEDHLDFVAGQLDFRDQAHLIAGDAHG